MSFHPEDFHYEPDRPWQLHHCHSVRLGRQHLVHDREEPIVIPSDQSTVAVDTQHRGRIGLSVLGRRNLNSPPGRQAQRGVLLGLGDAVHPRLDALLLLGRGWGRRTSSG